MTFTGSGDQIARVAPHLRDMGVVDDARSEFYRRRAGRLTAAGDVLTEWAMPFAPPIRFGTSSCG
jgi:hypothetical protein